MSGATGLDGLDPRKFLRMAALGMDEEIKKSDWPWMCTLCQRCIYVWPMRIDNPHGGQRVSPRNRHAALRTSLEAGGSPAGRIQCGQTTPACGCLRAHRPSAAANADTGAPKQVS